MKLLEMNHVKKSFDGLMVIQDISMSVEKGHQHRGGHSFIDLLQLPLGE